VARWAFRFCGPIRRLVTVSRFAGAVSTAAIKIADGSLHRPPRLSLSRLSCRNALTLLLYYCTLPFNDFCCFQEVMACCSPLDEAAAGMAEVENMDEIVVAAELERAFGENPTISNVEWCPVSPDAEDTLSEGGSGNENSRAYYFGSSTITVGKIKEMVEKCYFPEGGAHAPGTETMPEPDDDEAVVYEDFFVAGLCMPPHSALADILLYFKAQLHQLTPNAIAQLSKYFWATDNFGGVPSGSAFAKRYELYYQPKIVETPEGSQIVRYRCLNFHAKRDGSPKLSLVIKNKWPSGWTKSWFYC
jgi:hypothetical protein